MAISRIARRLRSASRASAPRRSAGSGRRTAGLSASPWTRSTANRQAGQPRRPRHRIHRGTESGTLPDRRPQSRIIDRPRRRLVAHDAGDELGRDRRRLAGCQPECDGPSEEVADRVDLGRPAAAGDADRLGLHPRAPSGALSRRCSRRSGSAPPAGAGRRRAGSSGFTCCRRSSPDRMRPARPASVRRTSACG